MQVFVGMAAPFFVITGAVHLLRFLGLQLFKFQELEEIKMYFDPKMCGKRIQVLRKKKGLTQLQLSFKINVSESHLRAIETGIRGASIDLLIECSEFFQVSLDYLVLGKTDPDKAEMMMQLDILSNHIDQLRKLI